jgi:hypothetical protein
MFSNIGIKERPQLASSSVHQEKEVRAITTYTGWWFGTCFIFPYIGNTHPN